MRSIQAALAGSGATVLFVLLWSSGAIFAEIGVQHVPAFAFLVGRFALASLVLAGLGLWRGRWWPVPGSRLKVAGTGALLTGGYSICYLLSLDHGLTPGLLATVLGVQPVLTLLATERAWSMRRMAGLVLALGGLALVVGGANAQQVPMAGLAYALASLASMTVGAIWQKRLGQAPIDVLPLQNAVSLVLCTGFALTQPTAFVPSVPGIAALLWMGVVMSVGAQLLFYRLMQRGNLVNVTSLFYLVPVVTALLDDVVLGHRLSVVAMAGMGMILLGLAVVFRAAQR
ncbi:multidrug DMT transporter permease [Ralstonia sp. A12]|uniref:DMT family transporter n=1 Tax=Ralstonia sp. A12 TaxID=1217052 RepID=UPI0005757933|nr:DMT family transporter [Ralstonia sp. A12]KHK57154.1 multidrug DMT transporter permease [Ralstonia sp. A12]